MKESPGIIFPKYYVVIISILCPLGSGSPFFVSSIRSTMIENTSSVGTLTQIPYISKYEMELEPHRKSIPYPGKEHIERVLDEYSHQVKDLQRRLSEVSCIFFF